MATATDTPDQVDSTAQTTAPTADPTQNPQVQAQMQPVSAQAQQPVPTQAPQAPAQAPPPPQQEHSSFLSQLLHAVGEVFAPSTAQQVNPQTGAIETRKLNTGERVVGGILQGIGGAAAGLSQHGPGSVGRGFAAGAEQQQAIQQAQLQKLQAQSQNIRETNQAEQQKQLQQANLAMMSQEQAARAINMKLAGMQLTEMQRDVAQRMMDAASAGGKEIASFDSNKEIGDYLTNVGSVISKQTAKDVASNNLQIFQGPDGKAHVMQIPKEVKDRPIGPGKMLIDVAPNPDDPKHPIVTPKPAPPEMKNSEYLSSLGDASRLLASFNDEELKQKLGETDIALKKQEANKAIADASNAYSEGRLHLAQAKNLEGGNVKNEDGTWNPASIPVATVEGDMDPTQLSKRTTDYNAKIEQMNKYSLEKYGKRFDLAQAQSDYKYATTSQNQNTLKMIKAMTDPGGSIDIAHGAAVGLPRMNEQTLNKVFNAGATEFGSKQATDFHTAMLGLADEYSKVMGGGVSSDTGRQQALDILKGAYSKGQIEGAIQIMRRDIAARQSAIIGTNRYLIRQYGAPAPPAPQGATNEVFGPDGKTVTGHVVNNKYVPINNPAPVGQ